MCVRRVLSLSALRTIFDLRASEDGTNGLRRRFARLAAIGCGSGAMVSMHERNGLEFAVLYLPADTAVVGGDFYDIVGVGHVCVPAVGDVSGQGSAAAAVTGLARHMIRSAALWTRGPSEVLANLNRAMLLDCGNSGIELFCIALLVFVRPAGRGFDFMLSCGGHPPPFLLKPDGSCSAVDCQGPPAGCYEDAVFGEVTAELASGDRLVLFTDGLTEARTREGWFGFDGVNEALGFAGPSAQDAIDALRRSLSDRKTIVRDDVAAVAVGRAD